MNWAEFQRHCIFKFGATAEATTKLPPHGANRLSRLGINGLLQIVQKEFELGPKPLSPTLPTLVIVFAT
jgi:hypothetical protein